MGTRWKRTDFCTSDHHFGITHGRKNVSPSRTPCDSDPFLVAIHKSIIAFMEARTDTLQWGRISCSLLYLLLSIGSLEQFWNVITLELRASFSARRSSLPFYFNGCLVSHGLYQAIISTVQQYPPTNNYTLHLHDHITATIHDPNLQQYNSTTPHYHRYSTVQPRTYHIHDSNLQRYLNNSTVPCIHQSAPIRHTFLTALRSTLAARDLYCTPGTSINCLEISTLYRRYIYFLCGIYSIRTSMVTCCDYIYIFMRGYLHHERHGTANFLVKPERRKDKDYRH